MKRDMNAWFAYRLGYIEHRLARLERSYTRTKSMAKRIGLFLALWAVAVLSNLTSPELSRVLSFVLKGGLAIL